jgi:hypothetical protein
VSFSAAPYSAGEGAGTATITVGLSPAASGEVTVDYATSDGTATAGADYTAATGTLTFNPGVTSQTFTVPILDDTVDEANETVNLALSNPVNATLGTPGAATLTITDDDGPGNGEVQTTVYLPIILKAWSATTSQPPPSNGTTTDLIQPSDLTYQGAFRLPADPTGEGWEWSNWASALTYYPDGDPSGPSDGYPGSLYGTGHDWYQYVAEVSIPVPVMSAGKDVNDLNTATMLQDFADIQGGLFGTMEMPRVGLAYLPPQGSQSSGKLYFAWAPHLDEGATNPSHGWSELNLSNPQSAGAWRIGEHWNYRTGDYLFDIPPTWADSHVSGRYLITGRFRDGGQDAQGPSLFAIAPWAEGNPPASGATLPATTLLLYTAVTDAEQHTLNNYHHSDEWTGGAWLTAGDSSAVIFVGNKGTGACWYGNPDGPCDTCEDRGWWSTGFVGQMLFYDPADLADVVAGAMEAWEPQPYATLDIDNVLYNITSGQQKHHVAAAAFDRGRGLLYVLEPLADEDRPLVHVWRISG